MDLKKAYSKGNECFSKCDYEGALKFYNRVLDYDSENETLLVRISQCYQEMGMLDESLDILTRVLDFNLKSGNLNKAIAVCKRILTIDPDDTAIMLKLANIMRHAGYISDAVKYYRVVARNYEYAGFLDKSIEVLQTIRELEKNDVGDLLELVKKESARGLREKASKNIHAIVYELKKGKEHKLLDDALNLALNVEPDNAGYAVDLAKLYFYTGRLYGCVRLCMWALHLNKESTAAYLFLIRALLALGLTDKARALAELVSSGDIPLDENDARTKARKLYDLITGLSISMTQGMEELVPDKVDDKDMDLAYLDLSQFTSVDHKIIRKNVLEEENADRVKAASQEKTAVVDVKKYKGLSHDIKEKINEAEILIAEGLYDNACSILVPLSEEFPENAYIKSLLEKAAKFVISDEFREVPEFEKDKYESTDILIDQLEKELDSDPYYKGGPDEDSGRLEEYVRLFESRVRSVISSSDYKANFELGIAHMELELWNEAVDYFNKTVSYLSTADRSNPRYYEAQIYYAVCRSNTGKVKESIDLLKRVISESAETDIKLSALYYLGLCYEKEQDFVEAKSAYRTILSHVADYRDIDVRLKLIGG